MRRGARHAIAIAVLALLGGCSDGAETIEADAVVGQPRIGLRVVTDDLDAPVGIASAPGDPRLFVLERLTGYIRIVEGGRVSSEPFLDLGERLAENGEGDPAGLGERGLLALVFHPDYAQNGRFFVYYADFSGLSEIVEYRVSDDPDRADASSAVVLREFGPTNEHFGGTLLFGPDGMLWFSIGDGGSGSDSASLTSPRGSILRFDASTPGELVPAPGNPYLGEHPGLDDLWATGLRNPWSMSIDAETGKLYVADVGLVSIEELDVVDAGEAGLAYGWPRWEGTTCRAEAGCPPDDTVAPTLELPRSEGVCAIVGGVVYRGPAIPDLQGAYLFSDYCAGFLRSFRYVDGDVTDEVTWLDDVDRMAAIGVGADGEVYLVAQPTGTLYQLVPVD